MNRKTLLALWALPVAFLLLFYFYPLGSILALSFSRSELGMAGPFKEALASASLRHIVSFTFWQATVSTLLTLGLGLPGAYLVARYRFRGKSLLMALTGIPFVMPTIVVAAAFYALLGPRGWVNSALMSFFNLSEPPVQFVNTLQAIIIANVFYNTTIVLRMVGDFWSHLDPRIEQAAQMLGANRWATLRRITLPLLLPALSAAALLVFIFDFTAFGTVLLLGGAHFATLEVEIYYQTISLFNLPLAAVLALLQLGITLLLTVVYTYLNNRLNRPQSLRPQAYVQRRIKSTRMRLLAGTYIVVLLAFTLLPLAALAARSLTSLGVADERGQQAGSGFTTQYYQELWVNRRSSAFYAPPGRAIFNSLGFAVLTIFLAIGVGLPAAIALSREGKPRINRLFDPLLMLPLGTSAVTLGLGFIIALDRPPLDLRSSLLLIPIAHTLVAFPFVVRSLTPALRSIRPQLRRAAAMMGASPGQVFRHIDLPMAGRAVLVAAIFAFTISLGEFGATALISRPEYPTLPVAIFRLVSQPGAINFGQALALSTILMAVSAAGMIIIERFRIADVGEF